MSAPQQAAAPPAGPPPTGPQPGGSARPGLAGVLPRWLSPSRPVRVAAAAALVLGVLWAHFVAGVSGDLAAQWAWADFAARHPGSAYDLAWYGGMHPASYSVLTPWLMALLGVRTTAVAGCVVSAAVLAHLVVRAGVRRPLPVVLWGAFALSCNVAAGRVTFALGIMFGLAALLPIGPGPAAGRRRIAWAAGCALLATLASPVAGLFVEVAAAALLLTGRRRIGWALAGPPPVVVVGTALLFPGSGIDPISWPTALICVGCSAVVALVSPPAWRTLRLGCLVYAVGSVLTWVFHTPIGSNVQRLALIFGSVLVLAALCAGRPDWRRTPAALVAVAITGYWTVSANIIGIPVPPPARQADALLAELRGLHADQARLEAVPMLNHWESWGLTKAAELARGWNRQADVQRNPLFYDNSLTPDSYHDWLRRWAVAYVALPAGPTDVAADAEAALIRSGQDWLQEVWHDDNWRLFKVSDAVPLADPPANVEHADDAQLRLTVSTPGPVLLRIPWSPWLTAHGPAGACLSQDGDWTRLTAPAPGEYLIDARYGWPRGTPC
ncbi:MFS transporter [Kitasatospora sp. NBC_01287]|uniref:MFS transporter n=1 Tax=Kitasatospora sp. NBC_01287 TaxID=2903573 RepID=UPI00224D897F|nr:MFS transporter [Kitasatospora sp. NBC_01287]MCX4748832.1 MFS transporter [Kitasatospora sp. NBC_01287]